MSWIIVAAANGVVAIAYLAISRSILKPLVESRQLTKNRLGLATAGIFFTCAVHHGGHTIHMLLPAVGLAEQSGLAMRVAFEWSQAFWDIITAAVGIYYWTLRRSYGAILQGGKLFDDLVERQRQALEINDNIVQGLTVAQLSLELDDQERSKEAMEKALASAKGLITSLLGDVSSQRGTGTHAGSFVRSKPADTDEPEERT